MTAMVDDETLDFSTSDDVQIVESFDAMGLKDELLRGIYAYGSRPGAGGRRRRCGADGRPAPRAGFEKPSAIQQRAIMPILKVRRLPSPADPPQSRPNGIHIPLRPRHSHPPVRASPDPLAAGWPRRCAHIEGPRR